MTPSPAGTFPYQQLAKQGAVAVIAIYLVWQLGTGLDPLGRRMETVEAKIDSHMAQAESAILRRDVFESQMTASIGELVRVNRVTCVNQAIVAKTSTAECLGR